MEALEAWSSVQNFKFDVEHRPGASFAAGNKLPDSGESVLDKNDRQS